MKLNNYTSSNQRHLGVAIQPSGRFIAVWHSDIQDGSEEGIFAEFGLKTFEGDFTGDGILDFYDLSFLVEMWLQNEPVLDIAPVGNPDGIVDSLDFSYLLMNWF